MNDSLIITTFNEGNTIGNLLNDILKQTKTPRKVMIVDGGSTDSTIDIIKKNQLIFKEKNIDLELIISNGANIAEGRNISIKAVNTKFIAVTDAGCRLDQNWYKNITSPLEKNKADLVGGFFFPIAHSKFQKIVAALTTTNTPPKKFIPSSRSISFKKSLWEKVGGYPEWLRWGEDTEFNQKCLKNGARYIIAKDAFVYWEVRKNIKSVIIQFYRYALGDGLALRFTQSYAIIFLISGCVIGITIYGKYLIGLLIYLIFPVPFIIKKFKKLNNINLFYVWYILLIIHTSRFIGYSYGFLKKILNILIRTKS